MMSDKLREAAQAVLKNTKNLFVCCSDFNHSKKDLHRDDNCPPWRRYNEALAELEAALAEPAINYPCVPLYTAPPRREWIGLTDADFEKEKFVDYNFMSGASFAEAKLKDKNGG